MTGSPLGAKSPVPNPSRRRRGVLLGGAGVVCAALLALGPVGLLGPHGDAVPVERITPRLFARRVPAEGNLRATRSTPILSPLDVPAPFRIAWLAADGERVRAGDVVVRFDSSEMTKRLADALADLESARAKAGKSQGMNAAELAKLDREADLARIQLANAKQFQIKDALVYSRHAIIESDLDQTLAAAEADHAQGVRHARKSLAQDDLDLLGIEIRKAEQKISQARAGLSRLSLNAPHDGVLLFHRNWHGDPTRVGDTVWNGQPLAELPDLSQMSVEAYVLEADASGLAAGKPASIAVESQPGVTYPARIARVDSLARPRVIGSPVQYFGVTLSLDHTDPRVMKPGQRVQALLDLDQRPRALTVPLQAVFQRDGKNVVYRRAAAGFAPVPVELGPAGAGRVTIEAGLRAGDLIALRDPTRPAGAPPPEEHRPAPPSAPSAGGGGTTIIFSSS